MRKVIFVLVFLMLAGGVLAMDNSVSVKTQPGDTVKVYAWPVEIGPLLNLDYGIADENGIFETTFFSLNVPDVKFTVFVIRNSEKIRDVDFLGHNISEPLNIDCSGVGCEVVEAVVEAVVVDVVVENESVVEGDDEVSLTGRAMFSDSDGSINWGYSIGGFALLLFLVIFILGVLHRGKNVDVLDEDEKELQYMEKKVKETAEKIKSVKDGRERKVKIENAKKKLVEEEAELKELQGGDDGKIKRQSDVVGKVEDEVEKQGDVDEYAKED